MASKFSLTSDAVPVPTMLGPRLLAKMTEVDVEVEVEAGGAMVHRAHSTRVRCRLPGDPRVDGRVGKVSRMLGDFAVDVEVAATPYVFQDLAGRYPSIRLVLPA